MPGIEMAVALLGRWFFLIINRYTMAGVVWTREVLDCPGAAIGNKHLLGMLSMITSK